MIRTQRIFQLVAVTFLVLALVFAAASFLAPSGSSTESAAKALERTLGKRLGVLEKSIDTAIESREGTWESLSGLPRDMVVYRYNADTLQSWANQFPLRSDSISDLSIVPRIGEKRSTAIFSEPDWAFTNHGPKWYVEKTVKRDNVTVVAGLEIVNELRAGSLSGINRRLGITDDFTVKPIGYADGVPVLIGNTPIFKLVRSDTASAVWSGNVLWEMLAALFLAMGAFALLVARPSWKRLFTALCTHIFAALWCYFRGRAFGSHSQLFSPLLYADGPLLYSLWAVLVINALVVLLVADIYVSRRTILMATRGRKAPNAVILCMGVLLISACIIFLHFSFKSILDNSDICLELYKVGRISPYTGIVYISFIGLGLCIPALAQLSAPSLRAVTGIKADFYSVPSSAAFAILLSLYFVSVSATLGFRSEAGHVEVWANRLAMERDIALEIQLREVEGPIARDQMFGALASLDGSADIIQGRLEGNFMGRISQDYDVYVTLAGSALTENELFRERIGGAERIWEGSHFFYTPLEGGRPAYTGVFTWYVQNQGPTSILISVESKRGKEDRGYLRLMGISEPGRISLPKIYSMAKYQDSKLTRYTGAYSYPTSLTGKFRKASDGHFKHEGWQHFVYPVSEGELIIVSRRQTTLLDYTVAASMLAIITFLLLLALSSGKRRGSSSHYYQHSISLILYTSLFLTLFAMTGLSIWYVNRRSQATMQSVMTSRVNTLQGMCQDRLRMVESPQELSSQKVMGLLEDIGNSLNCDITLFTPSGRLAYSTTPEVYERMVLGSRLNHEAYHNIIHLNKRYFIQKESLGRRSYHAMYAPVYNSSGKLVAVLTSPFTDLGVSFEAEAARHIAGLITIFLLLLILARFVSYEVVSRLFRPINELSRKMKVTDVDHLEPLSYSGDDEITPLVEAYNRMVHDLGESSRRLAQAERDKAWTDMARRVAHDLKNPLTPIKLQLQMLMRMKSSGNPAWQERFDEVAKTVLFHVDLLAQSADQFSTFARLYDQKDEDIDLDALVKEEVALFDSRDDISIDYYGLEDSIVSGPRPQLTRVVVNLITNAIQAVDEQPSGDKRILVAVRNSSVDGFYDIVVEDSGAGVSDEMSEKIFTPDFTTKSSGSGLGLAICKKIVEHCGGSISLGKSFTLSGAAFTVRYPKKK